MSNIGRLHKTVQKNKLSTLTPKTIRFWEKQFGQLFEKSFEKKFGQLLKKFQNFEKQFGQLFEKSFEK